LRDFLCVLCGKAFDREERKGIRKVRKEKQSRQHKLTADS
jgi:hypothetical protein